MCDCYKTAANLENHGKLAWWGYLHSNGKVHVKRWSPCVWPGNCDLCYEKEQNNPFVVYIIPMFAADKHSDAMQIAKELVLLFNLKEKKILGLKTQVKTQVEPRWEGIDLD